MHDDPDMRVYARWRPRPLPLFGMPYFPAGGRDGLETRKKRRRKKAGPHPELDDKNAIKESIEGQCCTKTSHDHDDSRGGDVVREKMIQALRSLRPFLVAASEGDARRNGDDQSITLDRHGTVQEEEQREKEDHHHDEEEEDRGQIEPPAKRSKVASDDHTTGPGECAYSTETEWEKAKSQLREGA